MGAIADKLWINIVLIERVDTLQKISNGWLYDSDTLRFFFGGGERIPGGQLRTCLVYGALGFSRQMFQTQQEWKKYRNIAPNYQWLA